MLLLVVGHSPLATFADSIIVCAGRKTSIVGKNFLQSDTII